LEVKILQEEMEKPLLTREQILFWLQRFRGIDISKQDQRQLLIDVFVNAVYLYDDRLVLMLNSKEEARTITLAEVESNFRSDITAGAVPRVCQVKAKCFFILTLMAFA
jgi:hypothetical protein